MSQEIRAIFENGLFRPLEPVSLADCDLVSLVISQANADSSVGDDQILRQQREALAELFAEADSLPLEAPNDGFSGADHDLILYGWKK
jgi:predicted DNA-binding antitoxin AbrB/MazE fold protein